MEVTFENYKLKRQFSDQRTLVRKFGPKIAVSIQRRIGEFNAVDSLDQISTFPPARLHLLHGDLSRCFAVSLTRNFRLVFYGLNDSFEVTTDKPQVTRIVIMKVSDYHG